MTVDSSGAGGLARRIGVALADVRGRHGRPVDAMTRIDGNRITCETSRTGRRRPQRRGGVGEVEAETYVHEAVAAVVRVTHQRVSRFSSYGNGAGEGVTEVYTLEASASRGSPRRDRWGR